MARIHLTALSLLGLLLMGCTGPSQTRKTSSSPPTFPDDYRRVVAPSFSLLDATGTPVSNAFYGGFNAPRPQFVDIDGDDDSDLFVQERPGQVAFFEHVTEGDTSRLVWRTDDYRDLDIGEWYRFADLNQDGVMDLLTEQPYSHIRAYRNVGTATNAKFKLFTDTLRTVTGEPIFSDRQNIPNVTDLGCNGKVDLFLGRLDGTITRYEAARDSAGMPKFAHVTDNFEGIKIVGGTGKKGPSLHGANTLTFTDIDGDGDSDLFWGDFFEPGLLLIENTGSCSNPILSGQPERFPTSNPILTSGYNAPALTDWTGNGEIDLFVGVLGGSSNANTSLADNFYFYENTGDRYRLRTKQFVGGLDIGSESTVALGDLDGDGRTDALVGNKIDPEKGKTSFVYPLIHTDSAEPTLRKRAPLRLPNAYHYAPALGELTGDGADDLILGTWQGDLSFHKNKGDGTFTAVDGPLEGLSGGTNVVPTLGDVTGDGLPDLILGNASGTVSLHRNTGTAGTPDFAQEAVEIANLETRAAPTLYDVDGDGTLDLLLGTKKKLLLLRNRGSSQSPDFGTPATANLKGVPRHATPAVGDLNGDGAGDLVMGGQRGGLVLFQPGPSRD
ncbi:MAG: FG-GAP repeat domain-containing protein [Salinibacter sp.]